MSKKGFLVTDRRAGLGDALLNLAAAWFLAKNNDMDVIIDWRRLPYTIRDYDSWKRHHINLYNSIFTSPPQLDGVDFYYPEEFPDLCLGPKTRDGYPYDLDHLPILSHDSTESKNLNALLKSSPFIRTSLRFGEANDFYPELKNLGPPICYGAATSDFNYRSFLSHLPLNNSVKARLSSRAEEYIKPDTVAIHFRHGNGETIVGRGPNWVSCEEGVQAIRHEAEVFLGKKWADFYFLIFSDFPAGEKLLLEKFPNSAAVPKSLPAPDAGAVHFDSSLNPVTSIQDSIIDMLLMTKCSHLMFTQHSTFSIPTRLAIPPKNQHMLFRLRDEFKNLPGFSVPGQFTGPKDGKS